MVTELFSRLKRHPIIAGIKDPALIEKAFASDIEVLFVFTGTIFDLAHLARRAREEDKVLLAHVDRIEGIGKDAAGMRFLAEEIGIDGVVTTRTYLVKAAKQAGMLAVQQLFLVDSEALKTGMNIARASKFDALEILPAVTIPGVIHRLPPEAAGKVIAGGLVETRETVEQLLSVGVVGISTSKEYLWPKAPGYGNSSGYGSSSQPLSR
ncbi:MAG TPA: glycerol-3-phosphate responsive antiterminator [Firmicutes bacterium]|nr:glycerol-3-phosphate responsive antiterminator [Bacillota bacterium]